VTAGCLEESTVLAFLGGSLRRDERSEVERHVATCGACADLVTWAAADQASVTRLAGAEGRPFVGELHPGARVGRYQILGAVGRGGMGEVYAAYHPDLDRRIALKVVRGFGDDRDTSERRARLLREARAIARLSHPNVVTVHDAGSFGDRVFIAMELIDGQTIDQWLRAVPRSWQEILHVFVAAGRGLAAAHAADVIHRDFKLQNVMIAKTGGVRVMDFGLARLAQEDVREARCAGDDQPTVSLGSVTKTGAFVGTPAYMSPEQFRRERVDARSDQFSFCVALHEALFGARPASAAAESGNRRFGPDESPVRAVRGPGWLRAIVLRGAAPEKENRYRSMDALLTALERGRTRTRRTALAIGGAVAVLLTTAGAWRVARGNDATCGVPFERTVVAWSSDPADRRRLAIHGAFAATERTTAESTWTRVSSVLDDYMKAWNAMYLQACSATHVRHEQSAEVLDLRMSCLNDDLEQVHALTDTLLTADSEVVSRSVSAAFDLTPVSRCADVALLKSAVPLPKDERVLREVKRLRRSLAEVDALNDVGRTTAALEKTAALKPSVEATGYKPLLAELLVARGDLQSGLHLRGTEETFEQALFAAESGRDDAIAARAAAGLVYHLGVDLGRLADSERWASLASSILDRLPPGASRIRAWLLHNRACVYATDGQSEKAKVLAERALALKEKIFGREHPDVSITLGLLAWVSVVLDRPNDAIAYADRAIALFAQFGGADNQLVVDPLLNKGAALLALGRPTEAHAAFERALEIAQSGPTTHPEVAEALTGLAEVSIAGGDAAAAVPPLERARRIYEGYPGMTGMAANTQFALARALWESGHKSDRRRARHLAEIAHETYASHRLAEKARTCARWLAAHKSSGT
jgi:tRNA A-37 threonylcarbamoyl transferase component Bud32/tetratricopeptide (TPR) repeat protein